MINMLLLMLTSWAEARQSVFSGRTRMWCEPKQECDGSGLRAGRTAQAEGDTCEWFEGVYSF